MSKSESVTEKEKAQALLISDLMLKNQSLERQANSLEGHCNSLTERILLLEKEIKENMLQKEWLSKWVVSFFEEGKIPLLKVYNDQTNHGIITVTCNPGDISFDYNFGLRANVYFSGPKVGGWSFIFELKPTVGFLEPRGLEQYPYFHYGFEKQKPEVVAKPKPRVRVKKVKPAEAKQS